MRRAVSLFLPIIITVLLSGCVAAAIPLVAVGAIGKSDIDRRLEAAGLINARASLQTLPKGQAIVDAGAPTDIPDGNWSAETILRDGYGSTKAPPLDDGVPEQSTGSLQTLTTGAPYRAFARHVLEQNRQWDAGQSVRSAVLEPKVSLVSPKAMNCEGLPPAVLIDLDPGSSDTPPQIPFKFSAPGLGSVLAEFREAEITIIWLSARPASEALGIIRELRTNNLLPQDTSDFLSLNRSSDDRKQLRRWAAAEIYCILATLGDARGDFDELYDYLLKSEYAIALERNFNNGWFIVQNATSKIQPKKPEKAARPSAFFAMMPKDSTADEPLIQSQTSVSEPEKEE